MEVKCLAISLAALVFSMVAMSVSFYTRGYHNGYEAGIRAVLVPHKIVSE